MTDIPIEIHLARIKHQKKLKRADALILKGDDSGAERIWRKYLKACPDDPVLCFNLAVLLKKRATTAKVAHEAGEFFAKVIESPHAEISHKADSLNNMGILTERAGRTDKAMIAYSFALKMSPDHPAALVNYGDCLRCLGDWKGADDCYARVAKAHPESAEAHYSTGFIALLMGDYERGWPEYRWRHKLQACQTKPIVTKRPMWQGEPLEGKTLMLTEEQGFGDSFMFIRYARPLRALGARIVWGGQERIREVMRCARGVADVVPRDDSPHFDYHLPLLDAPLMLGTTLLNIPAAHCLSIADSWPRWEAPAEPGKRKVALIWAGSPLHGRDRVRSIFPEMYQPIVDAHPEIQFYSLQIGPRAPEFPILRNVIDLAPTIRNGWTDTAQAIKWLDLLISVDTACVHLAGALDKEAWMLCPNSPDWRWLLGVKASPWYPRLAIFRQPAKDDWDTPLQEISAAL